MDNDLSVFAEPLFVNSDGLLYIVKDRTVGPRELTKTEETAFGGKLKAPKAVRAKNVPPAKKEKAMSITVVQREGKELEKDGK